MRKLLDGKQIYYPHMTGKTFKKAPKAEPLPPDQGSLDELTGEDG